LRLAKQPIAFQAHLGAGKPLAFGKPDPRSSNLRVWNANMVPDVFR
jgi:hypothetical protein